MKHIFSLLLIFALASLSGCGDARETSLLSPVSAAAATMAEDKLRLTAEIVWQDEAEGAAKPQYLSAKADTLAQAFEKAAAGVGGEFYFSHAQVFLLDEKTAKSGIVPLCEYLTANPEARLGLRLAVARGVSAQEVLQAWAPSGEVPGIALGRKLSEAKKRGLGIDMPLFRFYNALLAGEQTALPAVTLGTDGQAVLDGIAIFQNGIFAGFQGGDDDA